MKARGHLNYTYGAVGDNADNISSAKQMTEMFMLDNVTYEWSGGGAYKV